MGTSKAVRARLASAAYLIRSALNASIQVKETPKRWALAESHGTPPMGSFQSMTPPAFRFDVNVERTLRRGCVNSRKGPSVDILGRIAAFSRVPSLPGGCQAWRVARSLNASPRGIEADIRRARLRCYGGSRESHV